MASQNLQVAHAIVSSTNIVKIFTSDVMIILLFQTLVLIFLQLHYTHVYIDYKRKLLIGRAKSTMNYSQKKGAVTTSPVMAARPY